MFTKSSLSIWKDECNETNHIITLSKQLDFALGSGIATGILTEFCGPPGSGKTQLCFQLCVNVQIPKELGGLAGKSIFIDTKQGFSYSRVEEIASACVSQCKNIINSNRSLQMPPESQSPLSKEYFLNNIMCTFVNDYIELLAAIENIKEIVANNSNIRLICIDSFSFLFRNTDDMTYGTRINLLYDLLTDLEQLAVTYNLAVVLTKELTTQVMPCRKTTLVAALGFKYLHKIHQSITLGNHTDKKRFVANIEKAATKPKIMVPFKITKGGIRGFK